MEPKHKNALLVIASILAVMAFSALMLDLAKASPHPTQDPSALIGAWTDSIRKNDKQALTSLACVPDATLSLKAESVRDILASSTSMRLISTTEYPDVSTTKAEIEIGLAYAVRGKSAYDMVVLINSTGNGYCVLGFALDRAIWPQRQQAQE